MEARHRQLFQEFQEARELVLGWQRCTLVFVDVETYERDHDKVLEMGWSIWDSSRDKVAHTHFIVSENYALRNGRFVKDNKDEFKWGRSQRGNLQTGVAKLNKDLQSAAAAGGLVLLGHDIRNDRRTFEGIGVVIPDGATWWDSQHLLWAAKNFNGHEREKLEVLLRHVGMDPEEEALHNAGNDAACGLKAVLLLLRSERGSVVMQSGITRYAEESATMHSQDPRALQKVAAIAALAGVTVGVMALWNRRRRDD